MKKLEEIWIGDKFYPVIIDLNVLECIQEEYGRIGLWELELKGWHFKKDEDGKQLYSANGNPIMYKTEPSVRAIRLVLPLMINEGMAVMAEVQGKPYDEIPDINILSECEVDYKKLAEIILREYERCVSVKKACRGKRKVEKKCR